MRTLLRQKGQIRNSDTYDDSLSSGAGLETGATNLEDDLNGIRSQLKRLIGGANWYDAPNSSSVEALVFSFTNPGTFVLQAVAPGQIIVRAVVLVRTAFDGVSSVRFGTSADPGALLDASESLLGRAGQYENDEIYPVAVADNLQLVVAAAGATQGTGLLLYGISN